MWKYFIVFSGGELLQPRFRSCCWLCQTGEAEDYIAEQVGCVYVRIVYMCVLWYCICVYVRIVYVCRSLQCTFWKLRQLGCTHVCHCFPKLDITIHSYNVHCKCNKYDIHIKPQILRFTRRSHVAQIWQFFAFNCVFAPWVFVLVFVLHLMVFLQGHPEYLYGLVEAAGLVIERDVATWIANQGGWVSFFLGGGVVEVAVWLGDEAKIQWIRQEVVDGWVSLRKQLGWKDGRSPMVNGASGKNLRRSEEASAGRRMTGAWKYFRVYVSSLSTTHIGTGQQYWTTTLIGTGKTTGFPERKQNSVNPWK